VTLENPRDGVEAALFLTLILLEEKGLGPHFQSVLEAAAGRCSVEAASQSGCQRRALEDMARSLRRASSRWRPMQIEEHDPGRGGWG